VLIVERQFVKI